MNHLEFVTGLGDLEKNYSSEDKAIEYTDEQKDILWNEFKTLNAVVWTGLLKALIRTCSYLPKTSQFYNALEEIEKKSGKGKTARDIRHVDEECRLCNRLGLQWGIFKDAEREGELRTAVAKCSCRNAENWSRKIPTVVQVEANKNSGLVEWAAPGRIETAMEALRGNVATVSRIEEMPDDDSGIPF